MNNIQPVEDYILRYRDPIFSGILSRAKVFGFAQLVFYEAGTTTLKNVGVHSVPNHKKVFWSRISADEAGNFADIYFEKGLYRLVLIDGAGSTHFSLDDFLPEQTLEERVRTLEGIVKGLQQPHALPVVPVPFISPEDDYEFEED